MKVLSYKNLIMRFFFLCDRQSLICYVNRGMTFSTCELPRLNTPYSYCVSTSLLLYRQYLHPQRYFYAGYLMHHLHLHSELVHDLFSFHWNGILQYHPLIDWYYILIPKVCLCSNIMIDKVINHPACSLIHVVISFVFI